MREQDARLATLLEPESKSFITYDLEFLDDGSTIDLVSLGMKSGDGRRLYVINREMDQRRIVEHDWMRNNVWPHLPLKDLPDTRGELGQYPVKKCRCASAVKDKKYEWTCLCMNGKLDMDHPDVRPMGQIRRLVSDFIMESHPTGFTGDAKHRDDVKMWAWYGSYDHVRLAQCWGPMINLPAHVPMLTHDLKSEAMRLGNPKMPEQKGVEHNALADAEGNHQKAMFLWELATGKREV